MIGPYVLLAGLNGMAMVLMAAYGAHGLADVDAAHQGFYQTGWQIHAIHSLFVAMVGFHAGHSRWLHAAFWLGLAGMAMFCIPLYGLALGWWDTGGFVTPAGGFSLLAAWLCLVLAAVSRIRS